MITIFLRKLSGKGQRLQVNPSESVQELVQEISRALHYPTASQDHIEVFFRGNMLNQKLKQTVEEIGISENSIIHVIEKQEEQSCNGIQLLNVKMILNGRLFQYKVSPEETVNSLKLAICQDLQIKETDLTLSFLGMELDNNRPIRSYNFTEDVLLSASVSSQILPKLYPASKETVSQESSEGTPKIMKKQDMPLCYKNKQENTRVQEDNSPNIFSSLRFNQIGQKNLAYLPNSNSMQISDKIAQRHEQTQFTLGTPVDWQKPKLTLQSLSKPWFGDQKVIETESIVGDEQQESVYNDCCLELLRQDNLREYIFDCTSENTFEDAIKLLAKLERTDEKNINLMINLDEVSKSAIADRSINCIQNSPPATETLKRHRSSLDCRSHELISQQKMSKQKMRIVEWAIKLKSRMVSAEFSITNEV